eukprot:8115355-Prorocentrum_lima.AAC.1
MVLKSRAFQRRGETTRSDEDLRTFFTYKEQDLIADPVTIKFMAERGVSQCWEAGLINETSSH